MSSAILEILDKDLKVIGWGEYHGTSDTIPPCFVTSYDEIQGQKPYFLGWPDKDCEHDDNIDVLLLSNYGGESYWPSKVCMKCKVITGITTEPEYGYLPQPPDEKKFWARFRAEGWPKDGDPREGDKSSV